MTLIAANGDELEFAFVGQLNAVTSIGSGTLVFTRGTGRFADASGNGTFLAHIDLGVPSGNFMTVDLEGTLSY